ncbi:MAG: S9 family peptidase [Planctomycetota bacterium]
MSEIPFAAFVSARRAWGPALSPDGRSVAYISDLTGYPEAMLHQGVGRDPLALTEFRERVGHIQWTPDGRWIVLDSDVGGGEQWAVRAARPDGKAHRPISHDTSVMHLMGRVSADSRWLSMSSNARDAALFDLGIVDLETDQFRVLLEGDLSQFPGDLSPDGRRVLAERFFGSFRQDLVLVETGSRRTSELTPVGANVRHLGATFEPDGDSILVGSDLDRDFMGIARIRLEDRGREWVVDGDERGRDVDEFALSRDGGTLLFVENDRGWSRLSRLDTASGRITPFEHPDGVITGLSLSTDATRAAFSLTSPMKPPEVYTADVGSGEVECATCSPHEGLDLGELVMPEEVRFPSFDGTEIPGWLYIPPGHSGPRPTVVKVHGGPESQARPIYDPGVQYLVSRGYAVYEPNVRGSTGYGRRFAALDDGPLRFDAVKDLAAAAEFLKASDRVDGDCLALMGGSYGGFMALAGLAFFPDLWCAGVDIVGIANFRTFLANTGPYRRKWRIAEYGDPAVDGEFLDGISPVNHADRIRAPLLRIQGANDPRVPTDEAEQIVTAIRERGGTAEYLLFPDEGHGVVKLPNRLKAYEAITEFLAAHMA